MSNAKRHVGAGVAAAALLVIGVLASRPAEAPRRPPPVGANPFATVTALAAPGDVLFKSAAGGFWGNMARAFSEGDSPFGHVGIVSRDADGALAVIHAGGDPISREGRVRSDPIDLFLAGADAAALYRPEADAAALASMLAYAGAAAGRNAPFDRQFSLASEDRLYCTELVWRALSAGLARDATPVKSAQAGRVYISLEDLRKSPDLREIADHSPAGDAARQAAEMSL